MFKEKNESELSQLTEQELANYFREYTQFKNEALKSAIESGVSTKIEALKSELNALNDKRTQAITKALEAQGAAIEKMSMKAERSENKSLLGEKVEALKSLKNNGTGKVIVEKSMTIAANAPTYTQGYVDTRVSRIAERNPFIQNLLSSRTLSGTGNVIYFEQANRVGDADVTGEGVLKSNMDFDLVEVRQSAKKVTAMTKASMELIDDIPYMESLINDDLMRRVALKVDSQILTGSGIGANLRGIFTTATTFSAGSFALGVTSANRFDVLAIAVTQVYTNNFTPNYILLNPTDVAQMDITKTSTGEYVIPSFVSKDGREVKGVTVILNNGIPAGQYLVMDSSAAEVYTRQGIQVSIGYENDDFTKNMVTVLAEWRGLSVVKSNNVGAFVKGTFATDIAAILKP
jgi:HK97 family phage major capsid protein